MTKTSNQGKQYSRANAWGQFPCKSMKGLDADVDELDRLATEACNAYHAEYKRTHSDASATLAAAGCILRELGVHTEQLEWTLADHAEQAYSRAQAEEKNASAQWRAFASVFEHLKGQDRGKEDLQFLLW